MTHCPGMWPWSGSAHLTFTMLIWQRWVTDRMRGRGRVAMQPINKYSMLSIKKLGCPPTLHIHYLCDPAPQCCCLRRGPISRLPIVVVADHKRNERLDTSQNGGPRTPISPRFEFLPCFNAHGRKSWKARILYFGTLGEGEMFCRNSSTALHSVYELCRQVVPN